MRASKSTFSPYPPPYTGAKLEAFCFLYYYLSYRVLFPLADVPPRLSFALCRRVMFSISFSPFVSLSARPTPILCIPPFIHSILVYIYLSSTHHFLACFESYTHIFYSIYFDLALCDSLCFRRIYMRLFQVQTFDGSLGTGNLVLVRAGLHT
ncbi:hypothetical protein BDW68DRAFT_169002 [Aspergillus falconensis]